jgi:putative hydrolase of the HAD superfamily
LGQRYRLGIVSNFYGNLETVCRDAGIHGHFSVLTDSAVVGAAKPNPAIFRHALAAVGAEPGEAVFIGDSLRRDVAGAAAVGMPCIWLRADLAETPVPGNGSCVVVQRLDAIGELLL